MIIIFDIPNKLSKTFYDNSTRNQERSIHILKNDMFRAMIESLGFFLKKYDSHPDIISLGN